MILAPLIQINASIETPVVDMLKPIIFDEASSSKTGVINLRKGDTGVRVYVRHNSEYQVYYKFDSNTAETALLYNKYFVLGSTHTSTEGEHTITFIVKNEAQRITSETVFKYTVVDADNESAPLSVTNEIENFQPSFFHSIHFHDSYNMSDRHIRIKQGDYGIKIMLERRCAKDVFYCVDDGDETYLAGNGYAVISLGDTADIGNHTIKYIKRNNSGFQQVSMKITRLPATLYTVY